MVFSRLSLRVFAASREERQGHTQSPPKVYGNCPVELNPLRPRYKTGKDKLPLCCNLIETLFFWFGFSPASLRFLAPLHGKRQRYTRSREACEEGVVTAQSDPSPRETRVPKQAEPTQRMAPLVGHILRGFFMPFLRVLAALREKRQRYTRSREAREEGVLTAQSDPNPRETRVSKQEEPT